jgi:hypothetical protein
MQTWRSVLRSGPCFRLCWAEAAAGARPLAQRIGGFRIGCLAQAALGALDALLERESFGVVELFLACFCLAKEFEGPVVLLVVEVIKPVS